MCASQETSTTKELRFAQLPRSSIRLMAETASHYNLSDDVLSLLAENANCFLRQTMHSASQFMRHSHRKKLTTTDVDRALQWSDIPSMYGYNSSEPISTARVEREINLLDLATSTGEFEVASSPCLTGRWLVADGTPKPEHSASECPVSQPSTSRQTKSASNFRPARGNPHVVSPPLMNYFRNTTKAALGYDPQRQMTALNNLSSNARIFPILPHLTRFVANGVKAYKNDINQLTKLLLIVKALIINPSIYLGCVPLFTSLVDSLLYCILEPLGNTTCVNNDHWVVRDTASYLLESLFSTCVIPVNHVYNHTLGVLMKAFVDGNKPFYVHYGAVTAIASFGANTIENLLYPHISTYMARLEMGDAVNNADARMVFGALRKACEIMLQGRMEMEPAEFRNETGSSKTNSDVVDDSSSTSSAMLNINDSPAEGPFKVKSSHDLYKEFLGYFGEPFAMRLPILKVGISCIPWRKNSVKRKSASEVTFDERCDGSDISHKEQCFGSATDSKGACVQDHEQESDKFHGDQHEEFAEAECCDSCDCEDSGDDGEDEDCYPEVMDIDEEDEHGK